MACNYRIWHFQNIGHPAWSGINDAYLYFSCMQIHAAIRLCCWLKYLMILPPSSVSGFIAGVTISILDGWMGARGLVFAVENGLPQFARRGSENIRVVYLPRLLIISCRGHNGYQLCSAARSAAPASADTGHVCRSQRRAGGAPRKFPVFMSQLKVSMIHGPRTYLYEPVIDVALRISFPTCTEQLILES